MAERDEIIRYADELLEVGGFADYCPNGLQVPGHREVGRIATAVSAHLGSIAAAVDADADLLITHHGLLWSFLPLRMSEPMAERLRRALGAELSVAGYHLPLDAHAEIGNNALLARELGFSVQAPEPARLGEVKGREIGVIAEAPEPVPIEELCERIGSSLDREPLLQGSGPPRVRTLGIVTGSAAGEVHEAIELGLDAYLTGEPAEHAMADADEGSIHFLAAGHYATETFGVRRLGEILAERFGVEHRYLDFPNPV